MENLKTQNSSKSKKKNIPSDSADVSVSGLSIGDNDDEGSSFSGKEEPSKKKEEEEGEKTLRSPICCIMGHDDSGKKELFECIRSGNVQEDEVGGITQQIGATYISAQTICERTKELKADAKLNVPGLLVINTPGHEAFENLRSRGSGLCDVAILVVDIMQNLKPHTIESLKLLRMRNTHLIVALNKIDRLNEWRTCRNAPIGKALELQSMNVQVEFEYRVRQKRIEFMELGVYTKLYDRNKDKVETHDIVPISAISGEGIPDLFLLLIEWAQGTMIEKLRYTSDVQCTVLEVKAIQGLGTTIDVVLVNGVLHEGDEINVCGFQGVINTKIGSLFTPYPIRGGRVKEAYTRHKEIKAARVIKIAAQNLEHAVVGTALYVVHNDEHLVPNQVKAWEEWNNVMSRLNVRVKGVHVQASTLGSVEALLGFLRTPGVSIPVSSIGIGPVHDVDVWTAKDKGYIYILAFGVKVTREALELADGLGVKIFIGDTVLQVHDRLKAYIGKAMEEIKNEALIYPCILRILPKCVFNKDDPVTLGVEVVEGTLKIGTPISIPMRKFLDIGCISSIENEHTAVVYAKKGQKVAIKLLGCNAEEMFCGDFNVEDELVSDISMVPNYKYRVDEWTPEGMELVTKLYGLFGTRNQIPPSFLHL